MNLQLDRDWEQCLSEWDLHNRHDFDSHKVIFYFTMHGQNFLELLDQSHRYAFIN